ncbi:MAG: helix-turn-helix domain-containing protein [Spirochaetaceae bacterium]|jgi:transcriptional regulator with XRE-family HTH domain|nr:helix-turn-helix domain-containing protein [Spirochaetaceae bacterium]
MEKSIFAQNLKFYRKKMGMTQASLGEKTGIGQVSIANYERGTRFPGEEILLKIADSLGISLNILFSTNDLKQDFNTSIPFTIDQFMEIILQESLKNCLSYINGWMKMNRYDLENCFSIIIIPLLIATGKKWEKGEISISEEHLISGKIRELISIVSSYNNIKSKTKTKDNNIWLGFCAPSDKHDLVLFMLSLLLQKRGWSTIFLGKEVPLNDLILMLEKYKPSVISISISLENQRNSLEAYLQILETSSDKKYPIVMGGRGADIRWKHKYSNVDGIVKTLKEGYDSVLRFEKNK